ncbi:MAG: 50S ribosomal protein L18 [Clostridia bacterium]|nr:50S ribosomal protein L18 [Clostridia bacterium]
MINSIDKNEIRKKKHARNRYYLKGTAESPRLNVFRSLNNIYAQVIDDSANNGQGATLVSASSLDKDIASKAKDLTKVEVAKLVGQEVAKKALAKGIEKVVFDRGGYVYTGRVAAVADGAREAGLKL